MKPMIEGIKQEQTMLTKGRGRSNAKNGKNGRNR